MVPNTVGRVCFCGPSQQLQRHLVRRDQERPGSVAAWKMWEVVPWILQADHLVFFFCKHPSICCTRQDRTCCCEWESNNNKKIYLAKCHRNICLAQAKPALGPGDPPELLSSRNNTWRPRDPDGFCLVTPCFPHQASSTEGNMSPENLAEAFAASERKWHISSDHILLARVSHMTLPNSKGLGCISP